MQDKNQQPLDQNTLRTKKDNKRHPNPIVICKGFVLHPFGQFCFETLRREQIHKTSVPRYNTCEGLGFICFGFPYEVSLVLVLPGVRCHVVPGLWSRVHILVGKPRQPQAGTFREMLWQLRGFASMPPNGKREVQGFISKPPNRKGQMRFHHQAHSPTWQQRGFLAKPPPPRAGGETSPPPGG